MAIVVCIRSSEFTILDEYINFFGIEKKNLPARLRSAPYSRNGYSHDQIPGPIRQYLNAVVLCDAAGLSLVRDLNTAISPLKSRIRLSDQGEV